MQKRIKTLIFCLGILASLLVVNEEGFAARNLPPGFLIGDSDGIAVDSDGSYYVQEEDLMPGETFTKAITLMNTEEGDRPYILTMDVAPSEQEGAINFYEAITVVMELDGDIVYEGDLVGNGTPDIQHDRLELGKYAYGDKKELTVTFTVSHELPSEDWQTESFAIIQWNFYAIKDPEEPEEDKPTPPIKDIPIIGDKLPSTGEEIRGLLYKFVVGIFIISVVFVVLKRRKDSKTKETTTEE